MKFQLRKQVILKEIAENVVVEIPQLAILLDVSEITVRRDLDFLTKEGLLARTHGGAMKIPISKMPINFSQKAAINADLKDEICKKAADIIIDNEVVFLDCGSTVFRMCKFIKNKKINIVTNSLPIVNEFLASEVKLNFVGGEIDFERQAAHGKVAVEHINRYYADHAFMGVGGFSIKNGLSASSESEAETAMAFMQNAKKSYVLCDKTKLETDRYFPFLAINEVENLITNNSIEGILKKEYEKCGIFVL